MVIMKNYILIISLCIAGSLNYLFSQTNDAPFSYQGFAVDLDDKALANVDVNVRFTIYPAVGGAPVYQETHVASTDQYGVFNVKIGSMNPGQFEKLNFNRNDFAITAEVKRTTEPTYIELSNDPMLSVPYAKSAANGVPVGTIIAFGGTLDKIPNGWMVCDGAQISQTTYQQLYNAIGAAWGGTGGNFNLPDLRGRFLRGVSQGSNNDPDKNSRTASNNNGNTGNNVGTVQNDEVSSHTHTMQQAGNHRHQLTQTINKWHRSFNGADDPERTLKHALGELWVHSTSTDGAHTHTINNEGQTETRPVNANVYYIIKY
jgi:microcystin-dependent protein